MARAAPALGVLAVLLTVGALAVWAGTGRHAYTKFEVIEQVPAEPDPDDPFADTGLFDDDEPRMETVRRDEFHLGIFPTPQGLLDRHAVSVLTVVLPPWGFFGLAVLLRRRSRRPSGGSS